MGKTYKDQEKFYQKQEKRIREGRFCLCEGDYICDFHARGGYTTPEDDVKDGKKTPSGN